MKSILIGSVGSSKIILEEMIRINFPINMVFSLDEKYSGNVSGYYPLHKLAKENNIPYRKFKKINNSEYITIIREINPDYIFVIGLSQLISREIIDSARIGAVGFHPTSLPQHRGRAPLVWQILLGIKNTKCTLFFINKGIDSGGIIAQEDFIIDNTDYVIDVGRKSREAFKKLLRKILPQMIRGVIKPVKQDEKKATYLLKRTPEDGQINWDEPVEKIQRLVRAVSKPYPGAFSYYKGEHKMIFWKADYMENHKYIGIPGQIAQKTDKYIDIVCIDGLLRVYEYENVENTEFVAGNRFRWGRYEG